VTWNSIEEGDLDPSKIDRGVKFCQVLAVVRDIKETYHNISVICEKLKVCFVQCGAVQCCDVLCSAVLCSAVQCCASGERYSP
jgi:hypothetical protein